MFTHRSDTGLREICTELMSSTHSLGILVFMYITFSGILCFIVRDYQYQTLLRVLNVDEARYFPGAQCMSRAEDVHWLRTESMKALCCVKRASVVHLLVDNFRHPSHHRVISITELTIKVAYIVPLAIYTRVRRQVFTGKVVAISKNCYSNVALI